MISIRGLKKARVLAALYNNTKPQGLGFLQADDKGMHEVEAQHILNESGYKFDYLKGRVMKIDLDGDTVDHRLYDRDNGEGECLRIITDLKLTPGI